MTEQNEQTTNLGGGNAPDKEQPAAADADRQVFERLVPPETPKPTIGAVVLYTGAGGKQRGRAEVSFIWPDREAHEPRDKGLMVDLLVPVEGAPGGQPAELKTRVVHDAAGKFEGSWRWP